MGEKVVNKLECPIKFSIRLPENRTTTPTIIITSTNQTISRNLTRSTLGYMHGLYMSVYVHVLGKIVKAKKCEPPMSKISALRKNRYGNHVLLLLPSSYGS